MISTIELIKNIDFVHLLGNVTNQQMNIILGDF